MTDELKDLGPNNWFKETLEAAGECYAIASDSYGYYHFCGRPLGHDGMHQCDDDDCRRVWSSPKPD